MSGTELEEMLKAQPFRPFALRLADGKLVPVRHPEFAFLSPKKRTLHVYQNSNDDEFDLIDVMLVTALETLHDRRGNGAGKRKSTR